MMETEPGPSDYDESDHDPSDGATHVEIQDESPKGAASVEMQDESPMSLITSRSPLALRQEATGTRS